MAQFKLSASNLTVLQSGMEPKRSIRDMARLAGGSIASSD